MAISVLCAGCGRRFRAPEEFRGRVLPCPGCQGALRVDGPAIPDYDVFISHSSKDKPAAEVVCAALEGRGFRCWIAPRNIPAGTSWGSAIIDAIGGSSVMVLILSTHANESQQVVREVERGVAKGLALLPLRLDGVNVCKDLEYFLSTSQWLDATQGPFEDHMKPLVRRVRALLPEADDLGPSGAGQGGGSSGPGRRSAGRRGGAGRRIAAAAALGALAIGAAGGVLWRSGAFGKKTVAAAAANPASVTSRPTGAGATVTTTTDGRGQPGSAERTWTTAPAITGAAPPAVSPWVAPPASSGDTSGVRSGASPPDARRAQLDYERALKAYGADRLRHYGGPAWAQAEQAVGDAQAAAARADLRGAAAAYARAESLLTQAAETSRAPYVAELLLHAKAADQRQDAKTAAAALDEVLSLDAGNAQAKALYENVRLGYPADWLARAEASLQEGPLADEFRFGIASARIELGDLARAQADISHLANSAARRAGRLTLARAQARTGGFAAAIATARQIDDAPGQVEAYCAIAVARAKARSTASPAAASSSPDPLEAAGAIAAAEGHREARAALQLMIGKAQADVGDMAAANATARQLPEPRQRCELFCHIASRHADRRMPVAAERAFANARRNAESITATDARRAAFGELALGLVDANDPAGARQALDQLAASDKPSLLPLVVERQAARGDFAGARETVGAIADAGIRVKSMLVVAKAHEAAKPGDPAAAQSWEAAAGAAAGVSVPALRRQFMNEVAAARAAARLPATTVMMKRVKEIEEMGEPMRQVVGYADLAAQLARAGDAAKASELLASASQAALKVPAPPSGRGKLNVTLAGRELALTEARHSANRVLAAAKVLVGVPSTDLRSWADSNRVPMGQTAVSLGIAEGLLQKAKWSGNSHAEAKP